MTGMINGEVFSVFKNYFTNIAHFWPINHLKQGTK